MTPGGSLPAISPGQLERAPVKPDTIDVGFKVAHPPTGRGAFLGDGPFAEFEDLYQRMSQLLDGASDGWQPTIRAWAPHADLSETDQAYVAEIELAGQELATSGE